MDIQRILITIDNTFGTSQRFYAAPLWAEIKKYIIPQIGSEFFGDNAIQNTAISKGLFDSTAVNAAETLASFVNYGATNGGRRWVSFTYKEQRLSNSVIARRYLTEVEDIFYERISTSTIYGELRASCLFLVALGVTAMRITLDEDQLIFSTLPIESMAWVESANNDVAYHFEKIKATYRQLGITDAPEGRLDEVTEFCRATFSTEVLTESLRARGSNYTTLVIDGNRAVSIEGSNTDPVSFATWERLPGNIYGRGIGHRALPDIKSLNSLREMVLVATYKAVAPPYVTNQRDFINRRFIQPNEILFTRDMGGIQRLEDPIRVDVAQLGINELQAAIREAFYVDKISAVDEQRGIFGITERLLHPVVSNINNRFLSQITHRCLDLLSPQFPERPDELGNEDLRDLIDLDMINAFSQKAQKAQGALDWLNSLATLAGIGFPQVLDNGNADGAARLLADLSRVDPSVIMPPEAVAAAREQRNAQAQQQQAAEITNRLADAQSKLNRGGDGV